MSKNSILVKNEQESNRLSAQIMLISIGFIFLVYLLEEFGIFQSNIVHVRISFSIAVLMLQLPIITVLVLKKEAWWVKYMMVTVCALVIGVINMFLSYNIIVLYIFAVSIASLYFSRSLSWYSVILSIIVLTISQIVGTYYEFSKDLNFPPDKLFLAVGPRNIELLLLSLIYVVLSKKTRNMLENVMGAEEQKSLLDKTVSMMNKSNQISDQLNSYVKTLTNITEETHSSNEQIVDNVEKCRFANFLAKIRKENGKNTICDFSILCMKFYNHYKVKMTAFTSSHSIIYVN